MLVNCVENLFGLWTRYRVINRVKAVIDSLSTSLIAVL